MPTNHPIINTCDCCSKGRYGDDDDGGNPNRNSGNDSDQNDYVIKTNDDEATNDSNSSVAYTADAGIQAITN